MAGSKRHGRACGRYDIVRHAAGGGVAAIIFLVIASAAVGGNMEQAPSDAKGSREKSATRTLTYEGATTIGTNIMPEAARLFATHTGVIFSYIGGAGADAGFKAAAEGRATFGGVARELTADEKAKVGGSEVIGYDVLGVFVNRNNPVRNLTRSQLKQIFTGQATNWKQFGGGPDRPITVYSEKLTGGRATVRAFKDMVLGGDNYGPVKELEDATDCIKNVATDGWHRRLVHVLRHTGRHRGCYRWRRTYPPGGPERALSAQTAPDLSNEGCSFWRCAGVLGLHAYERSAGDRRQEVRGSEIEWPDPAVAARKSRRALEARPDAGLPGRRCFHRGRCW